MTVIVDNTGFSVEHWSRFTEAEFIEQNMKQGAFKNHSEQDRHQLLQFAYQQIMHDFTRATTKTKRL